MTQEKNNQFPPTKENIENCAISTIINIWSMIDWDKVDAKRAYGIWDELSSKIASSSKTTNSYENFVSKLCRKFEIRSLKYREISEICLQTEEYKQLVLKVLREQTQIIVLKVRLNNEIRKQERELEKQRIAQEKAINDRLNKEVKFTEKGVVINEN